MMRDFEVWHVDLAQAPGALESHERRWPCLSDEEHTRAAGMAARPDDQRHWRAAHIALRLLIWRWGGKELAAAPYRFSALGRPEIAGAPFSFSLSHSGSAALIALTAHGPVGVDLERPRHVKIADERRAQIEAYGQSLSREVALPTHSDCRFLQAWVRIEAAAKAEGAGVGRQLTAAGLLGGGQKRQPQIGTRIYDVRDLHVGPKSYAAVAAPKLPAVLAISQFPSAETELIKLVKTA